MDDFTWKSKKDLSSPDSIIFSAILDDKGRIVIPASIRNRFNLRFNSQVLLEFKRKVNGCSGVEGNMEVCETSEVGAIPAYNPKKTYKRKTI